MTVDKNFAEKVSTFLENEINPMLGSHGGSVSLIKVDEQKNVYVQLEGGCRGCPGARATMKNGIEVHLRNAFPEINEVIDATDHGYGSCCDHE